MKKPVKTVGFIAAAILLAKVLGLVRDMMMASLYGNGVEAVAYVSATRIPILFFDMALGVAIASTFIPVFNRYLQQGDKPRAMEFSNNFINIAGLISVFFCAVGVLFPRQLALLVVPGLPEETLMLTTRLIPILMPLVVFTTLAYSFVGILQSLDEFNIPAIISLVSNAFVILYLLFFNQRFGIFGVALAMLIGWSLQVLVQLPALMRKGYRYRFTFNWRDPGLREVVVLALPVLISSWIQPISVLITTNFASFLEDTRAVSAMDYANRFYIIVVGVFAAAITNYVFPSLSRMSGGGDREGFKTVTQQSLKAMILIIAPLMAGMMLLAHPLISIVYQRGAFGAADAELVARALTFYSVGMLAFGTNEIVNKCFYAQKDGKTPMVASICGIVVTVSLSFVMMRVFSLGVGNLALCASAGMIAMSAVLLLRMQQKIGLLDKEFVQFLVKILAAVLAMAAVVAVVKTLVFSFGPLVQVALCGGIGASVYFALLWFLNVSELREIIGTKHSARKE